MFHSRLTVAALGLTWIALGASSDARGDDLYLAHGSAFPGQLWLSRDGGAERALFRREATANPAFGRAATKLGQVAVGTDGKVYYASGLDGYVLHLQDGRHEIVSTEIDGQIRDLACTGEEHTVYFSVVPTPQNGAPLADGKIYRRDFWEGRASEVATVRQADLGGNWWGAFTIRDGVIVLATFEQRSRLFELTGTGPQPILTDSALKIHGLVATADGSLLVADDTRTIYRLGSGSTPQIAFQGNREFTEVALPSVIGSPGP